MRATKGGTANHVGIDSAGLGAGAVNEAKRLGAYVRAFNGGTGAVPMWTRQWTWTG